MPTTTLNISNVQESSLKSIQSIANKELGENYVDESVWHCIGNEGEVLRVATLAGTDVGFYYAFHGAAQRVSSMVGINSFPFIPNPSDRVGALKTIAVDSEYSSKGFGTALFNDFLELMHQKGVRYAITIAWESNAGVNIGGILKRLNFEPFHRQEDYWFDDSLIRRTVCPDCGEPPCHCAAVFYYRKI